MYTDSYKVLVLLNLNAGLYGSAFELAIWVSSVHAPWTYSEVDDMQTSYDANV